MNEVAGPRNAICCSPRIIRCAKKRDMARVASLVVGGVTQKPANGPGVAFARFSVNTRWRQTRRSRRRCMNDRRAASGIRCQATVDPVVVGVVDDHKDASVGLFLDLLFGLFFGLGAAG